MALIQLWNKVEIPPLVHNCFPAQLCLSEYIRRILKINSFLTSGKTISYYGEVAISEARLTL